MLAFMVMDKTYSKYYDEVVILLETGLRISEFCGLTMNIDMTNRIINVDPEEPGTGPAGCDRRLQEFSFSQCKGTSQGGGRL